LLFTQPSANTNAGAHDESKADIQAIISEGRANNGYRGLSEAQQNVLIKALQDHRNEIQLAETHRPSVQLHDVHTTFNMIDREVCYSLLYLANYGSFLGQLQNIHQRSGIEYILYAVKNSIHHHSVPVMLLSPGGSKFLSVILQLEPADVPAKFKSFTISGIYGV